MIFDDIKKLYFDRCRGEMVSCDPLAFRNDLKCKICKKKVAFKDVTNMVSNAQKIINQCTQVKVHTVHF